MQRQQKILKLFFYCLFFGFIGVMFYYGLGYFPLRDNNEGLYAEIAREMLVTGQWIIPQLNFVPYIEKPPMLYWLTALSLSIFGLTDFAARFVPATAAFTTCIAVFFFLRQFTPNKNAIAASLILTTSVGFILIGHTLLFDMLLAHWMALSLCCSYLWITSEKKPYLYAAYFFLGLAILTKGFITLFLIPGIVIIFLMATQRWQTLIKLCFNPIGILLLLMVTVPWHLFASLHEPAFAWEYFINEHVLRFLNQRVPYDYHNGPWYYYLPKVAFYFLPWTPLTLFFLKKDYLNPLFCWTKKYYQQNSLPLFLWLWFIIPLLFFSLSSAKAEYYMIVGIPPLAMLLGLKSSSLGYRTLCYYFLTLNLIAVITVYYFIPTLLTQTSSLRGVSHLLITLLPWFVFYGFIGGILCYFGRRRQKNFIPIGLIAGQMLILLMVLLNVQIQTSDQFSRKTAADYLNKQKAENVYFYQRFEDKFSTILFYTKRRVHIIDSHSTDLYFGQRTSQANGWFVNIDDFVKKARETQVYLVTHLPHLPKHLEEVYALKIYPVFMGSGVFIFSNKL